MTSAYLIVIYTQQLEANQSFYEGLGITFEPGQHGDGPTHLSGKLGSVVFELYPCADSTKVTHTRLGLMADDSTNLSDADKQHLNSIADTVHPFDNGQTYLVMTDPDGRSVEFLY